MSFKFQGEKAGAKKVALPTEASEQISLVAHIDQFYPALGEYLFAIPNGGKRTPATAALMRKMGQRPGVPDLFYSRPRHGAHGLYIEMKRRRGGQLSDNQKVKLALFAGAGYATVVCAGKDEALAALLNYEYGDNWRMMV